MDLKEKARIEFETLVGREGYVLFEKYIDAKTKINLRCPNGHVFDINPNKFKSGRRCRYCNKGTSESGYQNFVNKCSEFGFLIIGEYKNTSKGVEVVCPEGHMSFVKPINLTRGFGCSQCSKRNPVVQNERFKRLAKVAGFRLLGEYRKAIIPALMECPNGHRIKLSYNAFSRGLRCKVCSGLDPHNAMIKLKREVNKANYKMRSTYINNSTKIQFECDKGHLFQSTPSDFKGGRRCPECANSGFNPGLKGFLYMLRSEEGFIKIGISNKPKQRLKTLRNHSPFDFDTLAVFSHPDGGEVRKLERWLHDVYPSAGMKDFDGATEWRVVPTLDILIIPELFGFKQENPH